MNHTEGIAKLSKPSESSCNESQCHIMIDGKILFSTMGGNDKPNAQHMITCWNEHEALKAKARSIEVYDKLIARALKGVQSMLDNKLEPDKILCIGERLRFVLQNPGRLSKLVFGQDLTD